MKIPRISFVFLRPAFATVSADTTAAPAIVTPASRASGWMFSQDEPDTVEVTRRRQGTSSGPAGRPRAEAPVRRRDSGQGTGGTGGSGGSGGGWTGGSSGTGGGGGMRLPLWLLIPLVLCFVGYMIFSGSNNPSNPSQTSPLSQDQPTKAAQPAQQEPTIPPAPTRTPAPRKTNDSAVPGQGKSWTVMLYEDADDQILEEDMMMDMNEAEKVGSTNEVNIVAQIDRFKGGYRGDGDWSTTRRYFIQQDDDLQTLNSKLLDNVGEKNMADGATLVDFVTWAMQTYPAQHYALVLSDHGMGWPGGWSDGDSSAKTRSNIPLVSQLDDNLYLMELDSAMRSIQAQTGVEKLDLIGMDACLMSHLEVVSALQPYARYAVASQETEPALGWAYASFLGALTQNPQMDGAELGKNIVQGYITGDERIVDDQARSDFLRQGSPMGGFFGSQLPSAAQVANQIGTDVTISLIDLDAIPALDQSVNAMAVALQDEDQSVVASARTYSQSFTNIFGKGQSPYIDLGSLMQMLQRAGAQPKVNQAAEQVLAAEKQAVLAEKHGSGKRGATGISIYFPNSTLYRSPVAGPQSYTAIADVFSQESLWDDFLAYHYNDIPINPESKTGVIPQGGSRTRAPGAGDIQILPITLSSTSTSPGKPVTLNAQIKGTNIGYIYLFVGYYDRASNSIMVMDTDYLQSKDTRQQGGMYYPVWKQGEAFTLKLDWDPSVFQVSDGQDAEVVALTPRTYGASATDAVYTLDGTYTYTQDRQSRLARLFFRNGKLEHVYGFEGKEAAGAPAEIIPQAGDTFTIQETWMDLDTAGQVTGNAYQDGKILTFGKNMFTWEEVYAPIGDYVVGIIVQDLDGNQKEAYAQIQVK